MLPRHLGLGQAIEKTIGAGERLIRRVVECAVSPEGQLAVLRLGQELRIGRRRHTGVVGKHALFALGQTQCPAGSDAELIRPRHQHAPGQGRCFLCVHRPTGAEFVFRVQPIVQDRTSSQTVDRVAQLSIGIGCHLCGMIPRGGVRAAVGFAPDKKHLRARLTLGQAARECERSRRPLNRRLANDFRQARFAAIGGDHLGDDQHVGAGQAAVEPVNGEDVFTGAQLIPVRGDVERLELQRQRVVVRCCCAGVPSRRRWRVCGGHTLAVEIRDKTVVVFHAQLEAGNRP